ncbi:C-type lectin domain family 4 member A isoform X2 [Siniperca chuatsi]|uniref:C-type lectin domain family 4 member A isoform X2 n=1 Tax=Siniperca chuatsi TaxID=119488 RepID=UPI001CE16B56|nr:C-type lectin domain family 4 member A isoform X2 [Siniperca chuatsi]
MEEEITYSTVVFKNDGPAPKEKKEDPVKPKGTTTTVPDGEAAAHSDFRVLAVCLGILCVLLVASISATIYISVVMTEKKANLRKLTAANQQLVMERNILKRQTEEMSRVTDNLNRTLGFIQKFDNFPVEEYCPEKKCQPCKRNWILFQKKCYLFYNENPPWKTWEDSQKYCQKTIADLVVIDSLQEQEFINNHIKYYYDKDHGYWLGLHDKNSDNNWLWVDGHNDTVRYWIKKDIVTTDKCALVIPEKQPTASWNPAYCKMENKFICEAETLIWSN